MVARCWRRQFRVAATGISPRMAHSRFLRRSEPITRACTEKLSMPAGTPSWPMPMRTCAFLREGNLSRHRCIISCGSPGRTECTPDTCRAILHRTAVSACLRKTRLRSSIQSASELRLLCSEGRQWAVIRTGRDRCFQDQTIDSQIHASGRRSIRALPHRRRLGGREA